MKRVLLLVLATVLALPLIAQDNVGIGTTTPNTKAVLDVSSTDKGLLIPRMTSAQRMAIAPAATEDGMLVYDTDMKLFFYWEASVPVWVGFPLDNDPTNELQDLLLTTDSLHITNGNAVWLMDNDTMNEIQVLSIVGDTVFLTNGGSIVLPYDEDRDSTNELQTLSIVADTIYLSDGGQVVLPYDEDRDSTNELQNLAISNDTIFLTDGGFVQLPYDEDIDSTNELQDLLISNDTIFLTDGGFVQLPYDEDIDSTNELQILTISNDTVFLDRGGFIVLPSGNDDQNLVVSGDTLFIEDGNFVQLPASAGDHDWYEVGTVNSPNDIADNQFTLGQVAIGVAVPTADLHVNGNDGILHNGAVGTGAISATGAGTRMMWYPGKAAFRAGTVDGTQWDDVNIGTYSAAFGENNTVLQSHSFAAGLNNNVFTREAFAAGVGNSIYVRGGSAFGTNNYMAGQNSFVSGSDMYVSGRNSATFGEGDTVIGLHSFAAGYYNVAREEYSAVFGRENEINAPYGFSTGSGNNVTGLYGVAMGDNNTVSGEGSFATGGFNNSLGDYSFSTGSGNTASGFAASVFGNNNNVSGYQSMAVGTFLDNTIAASVVIGRYNEPLPGTSLGWQLTDQLFVLANGTFGVPHNAVTVLKNGQFGINTSAPTHKLHVSDAADPVRFVGLVTDNTIDNIMVADASGVVHIRDIATLGGGGTSTDDQNLTISNDTLFIESGNFVVLPPGGGGPGTDDQQITISNDTLFLEDGGFVVLPPGGGGTGTDDQNLTVSNDTLFIEGGNFVLLPSASADHDWYEVGTTVAPNDINDQQYTMNQVGIGIAAPTAQLHVVDGPAFDNVRISDDYNQGTWLNLANTDAGAHEYALISTGSANTEGAGALLFRDNTTTTARAIIMPNGYMGVNTITPNAMFTVRDNVSTTIVAQNGAGFGRSYLGTKPDDAGIVGTSGPLSANAALINLAGFPEYGGFGAFNAASQQRAVMAVDVGDFGTFEAYGAAGNIVSEITAYGVGSPDLGLVNVYNAVGISRGYLAVQPVGAASTGILYLQGDNGQPNFMATHGTTPDLGGMSIYDAAGTGLAGMYIDVTNNGIVWGDVKAFRTDNPNDPDTDLWYAAVEGPEVAAYIRGTTQLVNGEATIELPGNFSSIVNESSMTVIVTPLSADSKGLAVVNKSLDGVQVKELMSGTGTYEFDWEVKAVRTGFEDWKVEQPKGTGLPVIEQMPDVQKGPTQLDMPDNVQQY